MKRCIRPTGTDAVITRREGLALAAGAAFSLAAGPVFAKTPIKDIEGFSGQAARHGLSIFGDLKYAADFPYFDYVNPDAPKGGRFVLSPGSWSHNQNPQTFNTLNGYVTKGDAPPRLELIFDSLMGGAGDEADAAYGLLPRVSARLLPLRRWTRLIFSSHWTAPSRAV